MMTDIENVPIGTRYTVSFKYNLDGRESFGTLRYDYNMFTFEPVWSVDCMYANEVFIIPNEAISFIKKAKNNEIPSFAMLVKSININLETLEVFEFPIYANKPHYFSL